VSVGTARVGHAHMVLRGHRSIVNQVRYNKASALIISSGVEKIIKVCDAHRIAVSLP